MKPHIWQAAHIGHNRQAQVNNQAANRARNKLLLQVGQGREEIVQVTSSKIIQDTYQANMGT
jgi:hypothetical protein